MLLKFIEIHKSLIKISRYSDIIFTIIKIKIYLFYMPKHNLFTTYVSSLFRPNIPANVTKHVKSAFT